jgi:hypothetical protein
MNSASFACDKRVRMPKLATLLRYLYALFLFGTCIMTMVLTVRGCSDIRSRTIGWGRRMNARLGHGVRSGKNQ